jgi:CRP-like cAMP-binding protein
MNTRVTLEDVRRLTLFCEVEDRDLAMIAHGLEREGFSDGDFIFGQGEPADSAIFIADGEAEILTRLPGGGEVVVARVGPGAMIGETSLLEEGMRTASVRCDGPVTGLRMDRRFFHASVAQHDIAAFCILRQIMRVMADRLRNLNIQIVEHAASSQSRPPESMALAPRARELEQPASFDCRAFLPILPFFRELREADIDDLVELARIFTLPRGVTLFKEGDYSDSLFIVVRGALTMCCTDGGHLYPLEIAGPGKVCGADDVIADRPRTRGCHTSSETTLLEVTAADFRALAADQSWLSFRFQATLCDTQLESLARANRRLSHEITYTAMKEHRSIASLVAPKTTATGT